MPKFFEGAVFSDRESREFVVFHSQRCYSFVRRTQTSAESAVWATRRKHPNIPPHLRHLGQVDNSLSSLEIPALTSTDKVMDL